MICAPRAVASRTSASALAMLAPMSQPQDIWIAATVTLRAGRRKCSGSVDMTNLSVARSALGQRLVHLLGDSGCGLERRQTCLPAHDRRGARAHAAQERLDLGLECIALLERLLLDGDRQRPGSVCRGTLAHDRQDLLLPIQRQVRIVLEH